MLPFEPVLKQIDHQPDPRLAFAAVLRETKKQYSQLDIDRFTDSYLNDDIAAAKKWLQARLDKYPATRGIYLGLDTLNMENGKGHNLECALCEDCNPQELNTGFAFECDHYDRHLIKGLSHFFPDDDEDIHMMISYMIFLSYSGVVLREALLAVETQNDFIACWGFHDGDLLLLMNKIGNERTLLAGKSL